MLRNSGFTLILLLSLTMISWVSSAKSDWVVQQSGTTYTIWDVRFPTPDQGWAVVGQEDSVLHTTNSGLTWRKQNLGIRLGDFRCLSFLDTLKGYVGGAEGTGVVLKTMNGGATWDTSRTDVPVLGISFVDLLTGWVSGWYGGLCNIAKTTNGGTTWLPETSGYTCPLFDICFVDSLFGWAVGGWSFSDSADLILATTNGGSSWLTQHRNFLEPVLYGVWFVDRLHGWAVGGSNRWSKIFATTNGGANWTDQYISDSLFFYGVHFINSSTGWVVGLHGCIFSTTDGGANWVRQPTPTLNHLRGVWFVDSLRGWAVGDGGTILHTEDGGHSGVEVRDYADVNFKKGLSPVNLEIIPNPTREIVTLRMAFDEFDAASESELAIFDISGKIVFKRKAFPSHMLSKGSRVFIWDLKGENGKRVANGIYFIRAQTGNKVAQKKMVVCR